jgi:hypothetical protein
MKNLVKLESPRAATEFVHGLWRTELFRHSAYIASWVERFASQPTVFAEMSDAELETPHFGTFFGLTYLRQYDEPAVSDLYYLHEIVHASLLHYDPNMLFTSWYRKMNSIEFSASLETEGYVYLRVPGLREISFRDEIWADRYLGGHRRLGEGIVEIMRQDRYKAMQHPDPMDWCEQQISAYARQNFQWAGTWKLDAVCTGVRRPAFLHVEEHMARRRADAIGIDEHVAWLEQWGDVPFSDQARLFAPIYWDNKLSYKLRKL